MSIVCRYAVAGETVLYAGRRFGRGCRSNAGGCGLGAQAFRADAASSDNIYETKVTRR